MAGLLDWLTDGAFGGGSLGDPSMGSGQPVNGGGTMPPVQQTGPDAPPLAPSAPPVAPPMPAAPPPTPDPTPAAGPPDPPVPLPAPRPPGADAAPPPPPPAPGPASPPPVPSTPPAAPGAPMSLAPDAPGPSARPYQLGDQTALGRALGIDPKSAVVDNALAGLGGGLTAAGNSRGKSPGQAFASGAGGSLEAGAKETHAQNKDAQAYLTAAISAKKAGDDATYKTNYTAYLAAKLKSEQEAAASKEAVPNKNDSPTQLYLAAQRNVAADPLVKGAMTAYQSALKGGNGPNDPEVQKAKAAYEQTVQERQAAHLAGVGLHPQTAAEVAKQPGMTQANPVDAGKAGITSANIGKKLQPGQYYTNPADGKVYQFKGSPSKSDKSSSATPSVSKPESPDPLDPDKVPASGKDEDD